MNKIVSSITLVPEVYNISGAMLIVDGNSRIGAY